MLLPKHDVPLSPQHTVTEISTNRHNVNVLSPQSHATSQTQTGFEKQLTTLFSSRNLTDNLGNFRPGENLPPPAGVNTINNKKQITLNSKNTTENDDSSLSTQDQEYAFTDEPNDLSRTGFYESTNYNQRPGTFFYSPTSEYTPEADTADGKIQQRGVISTPIFPQQQQQQQQQQQSLKNNNNQLIMKDSLDNAESFIDGEQDSDYTETSFASRPGSQENAEVRRQKTTNPNQWRYPNPRKFGWNYFKDQKAEEEAEEEKQQKKFEEEEESKRKQNMMYPKPSINKTKQGQYTMKSNGPLVQGTKVNITPANRRKAAAKSFFEDALSTSPYMNPKIQNGRSAAKPTENGYFVNTYSQMLQNGKSENAEIQSQYQQTAGVNEFIPPTTSQVTNSFGSITSTSKFGYPLPSGINGFTSPQQQQQLPDLFGIQDGRQVVQQKQLVNQKTTLGEISENILKNGKEKTVSIKVPSNVTLSTVLKNIYEHMYQTYFNKRPKQNGVESNEAKKLIDGLVQKDMTNLPSIVLNTTKKDAELSSSAHARNRPQVVKDNTKKIDDFLQKMYQRQVKVAGDMQQQHNMAATARTQPLATQLQQAAMSTFNTQPLFQQQDSTNNAIPSAMDRYYNAADVGEGFAANKELPQSFSSSGFYPQKQGLSPFSQDATNTLPIMGPASIEQNLSPPVPSVYVSPPRPIIDSTRFMYQQQNVDKPSAIFNNPAVDSSMIVNAPLNIKPSTQMLSQETKSFFGQAKDSLSVDQYPISRSELYQGNSEALNQFPNVPTSSKDSNLDFQTASTVNGFKQGNPIAPWEASVPFSSKGYINKPQVMQKNGKISGPLPAKGYINNPKSNGKTSGQLSAKDYVNKLRLIQKNGNIQRPLPTMNKPKNSRKTTVDSVTSKELFNSNNHQTNVNHQNPDQIDRYFKQLDKFKTNHQNNEFNALANKILTMPLREINRQHQEGNTEKSKKSLVASGPSIMNAEKSIQKIDGAKSRLEQSNDISNQLEIMMPGVNQAFTNNPSTKTSQNGYFTKYRQENRQYAPYYSSVTGLPSNIVRDVLNKPPSTTMQQKASFIESVDKEPTLMKNSQGTENEKSVFNGDPFENKKRNTIARVKEKLALLRKRKSVDNLTKKWRTRTGDLGVRKSKIQTTSAATVITTDAKPVKKWFTIDPLMKANSEFLETKSLESIKNNHKGKRKNAITSQNSITQNANNSTSGRYFKSIHKRQNTTTTTIQRTEKNTPPVVLRTNQTKRSKIQHQQYQNWKTKNATTENTRSKVAVKSVQPLLKTSHILLKKSSIELSKDVKPLNSINAWSLNSSFVDTLNKDFTSSRKKSSTATTKKGSTRTKKIKHPLSFHSRKSVITHHHKQPKLKHKERKRKVLEKEHEDLTKGIMNKALNANHTQPVEAASQAQIVPPVDRLLGNNTILSEPSLFETATGNMSSSLRNNNDTVEAYASSPLKEETGSSRSSIVLGELAFNSALEKPKVLVFNDEAMGEKTRPTDFGANDVEESLMKSMEVNDHDDGENNNRKKKKSEIATAAAMQQ